MMTGSVIRHENSSSSLKNQAYQNVNLGNMGLLVRNNMSWKYEIRNGEIVMIVRKVRTSNK